MPKSAAVPVGTKSDRFRVELAARIAAADPYPIASAARSVGIGYAFAYGIARRAGLAETGAGRRPEPNARIAAVIAAVRPEWSAARVASAASAVASGKPVPSR